MKKLLEKVFSVKKENFHKVITLLGFKIKFNCSKNVYVGAGEDYKYGYINCDIRRSKNVKIVCKAWELSKKIKDVEKIYSRQMCEHLTFTEFRYTLKDWIKALKHNGTIHIEVPNIDAHIEQFKNAVFELEQLNISRSNLSWSLAGFWGWQREDYISSSFLLPAIGMFINLVITQN